MSHPGDKGTGNVVVEVRDTLLAPVPQVSLFARNAPTSVLHVANISGHLLWHLALLQMSCLQGQNNPLSGNGLWSVALLVAPMW